MYKNSVEIFEWDDELPPSTSCQKKTPAWSGEKITSDGEKLLQKKTTSDFPQKKMGYLEDHPS